ncbi:MAG: hypothetical protein AAB403_06220 [Planctomycetota bacterium]
MKKLVLSCLLAVLVALPLLAADAKPVFPPYLAGKVVFKVNTVQLRSK